jgi:hypothetical protein
MMISVAKWKVKKPLNPLRIHCILETYFCIIKNLTLSKSYVWTNSYQNNIGGSPFRIATQVYCRP